MKKKRMMSVDVESDRCSGCARCVAVCPEDVFVFRYSDGRVRDIQIASDRCTGCHQCVVMCPTGAVSVEFAGTVMIPALEM